MTRFKVHRQDIRREFPGKADIKNSSRFYIGDQIIEISESGCKIRIFRKKARHGESVIIKLENLEPLRGSIRWIDGFIAGVEFDRKLHPAVVDHLVRTRLKTWNL